jgi:hypothetical protein
MRTIQFYGVIAVKFSNTPPHHRYISHVFIIEKTDDGYSWPGTLYKKEEAIKLMKVAPLYTLEWDYKVASWKKGAEIDTEVVNNITYLRTVKDGTILDNLKNLIDYDYFGRV